MPEQLTDLGNGRRLVRLHGHDVRHCFPWGKWLVWDGTRWRIDDIGGVEQRAKQTALAIYHEAARAGDEAKASQIAAHAKASQAVSRIRAMIDLARSEPGIPILPADLDKDPWLLNVSNGTIDLRTGELREHRREDLITKLAPVEYHTDATCPTWLEFVKRILICQDLIKFLQRAIGYALTGDVSEQVLFLMHGTGSNGKSTMLQVLLKMLGDYAAQIQSDLLMIRQGEVHPTGLTDLHGRRLISAIETEDGRRIAEVLVKQMTGGDRIRARRMKEDFWEFEPRHKLFLAANHKPVIRGTDNAIWRRIRLVPFTVTIADSDRNPHLAETLVKELPGILAWSVRGCLDWHRDGLGVPDEVRLATAGYRAEMDVLGAFLAECCTTGSGITGKASDLYQRYCQWCEANGEHPLAQRNFGLRLSERGYERRRGTGGSHWWHGIGLLAPE